MAYTDGINLTKEQVAANVRCAATDIYLNRNDLGMAFSVVMDNLLRRVSQVIYDTETPVEERLQYMASCMTDYSNTLREVADGRSSNVDVMLDTLRNTMKRAS